MALTIQKSRKPFTYTVRNFKISGARSKSIILYRYILLHLLSDKETLGNGLPG